MKVIVCGSHTYGSKDFVYQSLDAFHAATPITLLITGAAAYIDTLALQWAAARKVPRKGVPADWKTHGLAAGPIRNRYMLTNFRPDHVIAFPGGPGTANMVDISLAANVPVTHFNPET